MLLQGVAAASLEAFELPDKFLVVKRLKLCRGRRI